jgi:plastocyanin
MKKILASIAVTVSAAAFAVPALAAGRKVTVGDDFFKAKTVHIKAGTTVTWKWAGHEPHNVKGKGFSSKTQRKGTFRHKFAKKGTYHYVCTIHDSEGMKGTIIVR